MHTIIEKKVQNAGKDEQNDRTHEQMLEQMH